MKETNPNLDYYTFPLQKDQAISSQPTPPEQPPKPPHEGGDGKRAPLTPGEVSAKRAISRIGVAVVCMIGVWLAFSYGISHLAAQLEPDLLMNTTFLILSSTLPLILVAIPVAYLIVRKMPVVIPQKQQKRLGGAKLTLLLFMSMGILVVGALISNFAMFIFAALSGIEPVNSLNVVLDAPIPVILLFTVLLSPTFEEILCRKILLTRLLPYGEATAILLSSAIFACIHGNLFQFVYAFGVGALFSYVYLRTGRLRYCITLHILVNALGSMLTVFLISKIDPALLEAYEAFLLEAAPLTKDLLLLIYENLIPLFFYGQYVLLEYGVAIAGVVLLIVFFRRMHLVRTQEDIAPSRSLYLSVTSFGGVLLLCISILFTIMNMGIFP